MLFCSSTVIYQKIFPVGVFIAPPLLIHQEFQHSSAQSISNSIFLFPNTHPLYWFISLVMSGNTPSLSHILICCFHKVILINLVACLNHLEISHFIHSTTLHFTLHAAIPIQNLLDICSLPFPSYHDVPHASLIQLIFSVYPWLFYFVLCPCLLHLIRVGRNLLYLIPLFISMLTLLSPILLINPHVACLLFHSILLTFSSMLSYWQKSILKSLHTSSPIQIFCSVMLFVLISLTFLSMLSCLHKTVPSPSLTHFHYPLF